MLEEWQQQEGHQFWCKQTCNNCYLQVNWLQVRASWAKPRICTKRAQHTAYHLLVGWLAGWLAGWRPPYHLLARGGYWRPPSLLMQLTHSSECSLAYRVNAAERNAVGVTGNGRIFYPRHNNCIDGDGWACLGAYVLQRQGAGKGLRMSNHQSSASIRPCGQHMHPMERALLHECSSAPSARALNPKPYTLNPCSGELRHNCPSTHAPNDSSCHKATAPCMHTQP